MANAVIVTDMLRGFMEPGCALYCGERARRIIQPIRRLLEKESAAGSHIFYICDNHDPDDLEFNMFPPHCVTGSTETEVIPEFSHIPGDIITKQRYSSFYGTGMAAKLARLKPDKIIVCGVCTDICVCYTVADARARDYPVEVPVDCVASFNERGHQYALDHMQNVLGAHLVLSTGGAWQKNLFPAMPDVITGDTADIYFRRTLDVLEKENLDPVAVMEIFPRAAGVFCGIKEVLSLLEEVLPPDNREVWALDEGETMSSKEVCLRIKAPYRSYGLYETAMAGMLSHPCGWATTARECAAAAGNLPVISFGARHIHPSVAGLMDYAAIVGGCKGCSSIAGARLAGIEASGTMPHALILIMGDTVKATLAFDRHMPPEIRRVSLVDTFRNEDEESVRVASALREKLGAVRLDTPSELGGVTVALVKKVRAALDEAGFTRTGIFITGGMTPERIRQFISEGAPMEGFGVGSYISGAKPIDFTADLHEIDGKPIAKRGRSPGITPNPRLKRVL